MGEGGKPKNISRETVRAGGCDAGGCGGGVMR